MIWFVQSASVDDDKEAVVIEMQDSVELTFALKYLSNFSKVRALSPHCIRVLPRFAVPVG
jgi:hypothetical protein